MAGMRYLDFLFTEMSLVAAIHVYTQGPKLTGPSFREQACVAKDFPPARTAERAVPGSSLPALTDGPQRP